MWHSDFGVLLKHTCHQAIAADIVDTLQRDRGIESERGSQRERDVQSERLTMFPFPILVHQVVYVVHKVQGKTHLADVTGPCSFFLPGGGQ